MEYGNAASMHKQLAWTHKPLTGHTCQHYACDNDATMPHLVHQGEAVVICTVYANCRFLIDRGRTCGLWVTAANIFHVLFVREVNYFLDIFTLQWIHD